jgi:hypothetical protein
MQREQLAKLDASPGYEQFLNSKSIYKKQALIIIKLLTPFDGNCLADGECWPTLRWHSVQVLFQLCIHGFGTTGAVAVFAQWSPM